MNSVAELMEKFCWKSKIRSVWKNDPDLFDNAMAHIHSEAAVFDAIIRSKNSTVPSLEKITRTVQFLEQNSFWRSNPFSLVTGTEDDPALAQITSRLQMKSVRDLWQNTNIKNPKETEFNTNYIKPDTSGEFEKNVSQIETREICMNSHDCETHKL